MPTYEYVCRDCGHRFEVWQSMSDEALTICPECGGELRKVFGAPAISFKGSGFYATDHGRRAKKDEGGAKKEDGGTRKESTAKREPTSAGDTSSGDSSSKDPSSSKPAEKAGSVSKKDGS